MGSQRKNVSDHLLQNEIKKYDILFLGEAWQYKDNLDNLHHLLGYFHVLFTGRISRKGHSYGTILIYYRSELQRRVSVYDKSTENSPKNPTCTKLFDSNVTGL